MPNYIRPKFEGASWLFTVKHGLVERVCDWPNSTLHRDVRAGLLPPDRGKRSPVQSEYEGFGER